MPYFRQSAQDGQVTKLHFLPLVCVHQTDSEISLIQRENCFPSPKPGVESFFLFSAKGHVDIYSIIHGP